MTHGWPTVKLKDVVKGLYDGPHATPKESTSGAIFLGIKNVTEDGRLDLSDIRYIAEDDMPKWTKRVTPQKDDIVFSYEATLHRYARIPEEFRGCLGRRMALVRVNEKVCDVDFLFSYFLSPLWRYEVERHILTGATVDRIPLTQVPNFKVHLPPLPAQKKIAGILSAYDDLIENNLKRIKLLEEMAQITYEEWFVRLRFPGHESTPINPITGLPEGWRTVKLRDVLQLNYGKALKADTRIEGHVPVYGSSGIVGTHNEALVAGSGIILGRKGNVGSVFWSHASFYPIDTVYFVTSNHTMHFLYHALKNSKFNNSDAAVPGLNRDAAYAVEISLPPEEIEKQFSESEKRKFLAIQSLEKQNQYLREARDILLPRLMTGVIDVESYTPAKLDFRLCGNDKEAEAA